MDIPPEVIAAKESIEDFLLQSGLITGIGFGVSDEEQMDPEDLALRVFVADANNIAPEVQAAIQFFPFPVVIIQRNFTLAQLPQLPDDQRHRPVEGGVSIAASRFFQTHSIHVGTLGAVVVDALDPSIQYGLSNFHVMCVDGLRQEGDEIVQPRPSVLGPLSGDTIGTLSDWSYPETSIEGFLDAAICRLKVEALSSVVDIGATAGSEAASVGMLVTKRGRTTGQTFGVVSGTRCSIGVDYPALPPVATLTGQMTTLRVFKDQIQIKVDFPQSLVFCEDGDSGSVIIGPNNQVVGLLWAAASTVLGDPLTVGVACSALRVELELGIRI